MPFPPEGALRYLRSGTGAVQCRRSGCVWLYAAMACSGMLPSVPASKPARRAQFLTSSMPACHCNQVIWARGSGVRASRMVSGMSSVARRGRFMASSAIRRYTPALRPDWMTVAQTSDKLDL